MKKLLLIACISLLLSYDVNAQFGGGSSGASSETTFAVSMVIAVAFIVVGIIMIVSRHRARKSEARREEQALQLKEIPINLTL